MYFLVVSWWWDVVAVIGGVIISGIFFADELAKFTLFENLKSLAFKAPIFLLGAFLVIWRTLQKNFEVVNENDEQRNRDEKEHVEQLRKTADNAEYKRRQSNAELIQSFGDAIGKYKLHYDSTTETLRNMLNDTASKKTYITYGNDPHLILIAEETVVRLKKDSSTGPGYTEASLTFIAEQSSMTDVECRAYIIQVQSHPVVTEWLRYKGSYKIDFNTLGTTQSKKRTLPIGPPMDDFFVYLHGTFKNSDRSKEIKVSEGFRCTNYGMLLSLQPQKLAELKDYVSQFIN